MVPMIASALIEVVDYFGMFNEPAGSVETCKIMRARMPLLAGRQNHRVRLLTVWVVPADNRIISDRTSKGVGFHRLGIAVTEDHWGKVGVKLRYCTQLSLFPGRKLRRAGRPYAAHARPHARAVGPRRNPQCSPNSVHSSRILPALSYVPGSPWRAWKSLEAAVSW